MSSSNRNQVIVFVVDDQLDGNFGAGRFLTYQACLEKLNECLGDRWRLDVKWCRNPSDVIKTEVEPGQPALAILDMVLDGVPWPAALVSQMDRWLLDRSVPVLLISEHFHQPAAMERANILTGELARLGVPFQFMLWQSIVAASSDKSIAQQLDFVINSMLSVAFGRDHRFRKIEDEPITFLHITDPHFGLAKWDAGALSVLRGRFRDLRLPASDFIAITGDVSNRSVPSEYARATEYLNSIAHNGLMAASTSALPPERVFVVPGNHDYSRRVALAANLIPKDNASYQLETSPEVGTEWIRLLAMEPFNQFSRELAGRDLPWTPTPGYRVDSRFVSAGLIFLELDIERHSIDGYQIGATDEEIRNRLNAATNAIGQVRMMGECVVVLAHRNEDSAWTSLGGMLKNFFAGLGTDGPVVLVCGHEHDAKVAPDYGMKVLLVRGVPSIAGAKLPPEQLHKVHYVSLNRSQGKVVGASVFTFQQTPGEWLYPPTPRKFTWTDDGEWR